MKSNKGKCKSCNWDGPSLCNNAGWGPALQRGAGGLGRQQAGQSQQQAVAAEMAIVSMAASVGAQPGDWDSGCPPLLHTTPGVLPMALTHSSTRKMLINSSSADSHQIG